MMDFSDNYAANILVDLLGMENVQKRLRGWGLKDTLLRRRMMDLEAARAGRENVTTPREMVTLLDRLYRGEVLNAENTRRAIDIMKRNDGMETGFAPPSAGADPHHLRLEVGKGIHRTAFAPHLEVQVSAMGVSSGAHLGDRVPLLDPVPFADEQPAGVGIKRRHTVAVIDHHGLAVFPLAARAHDDPRGHGPDLLALRPVDVDPVVVVVPAALAEAAGDLSVQRPGDSHQGGRLILPRARSRGGGLRRLPAGAGSCGRSGDRIGGAFGRRDIDLRAGVDDRRVAD